jgi:hypothetical protein
MRLLFLVLAMFVSLVSFSQGRKRHRHVTNEKGAIYISWGYNRSAYTKSDIRFQGQGYNFNTQYAKARDNQSSLSSGDYSLTSLSVPQFNFKIGYYYKNKWSIALGIDHMKYVFLDQNKVVLSGSLSYSNQSTYIGSHVAYGSAILLSKNITTVRDSFHYENSQGLNYIHAELGLAENIYTADKKGDLKVMSNVGFGAGCLLSYTSLYYNRVQNPVTRSLSGYGLSTFAGLRFELFKRVYLYTNLSVGFLHKVHEKTSTLDQVAYVKQYFGYSQIEAGLGLFLFKRAKNGCDSCPVW